MPAVHTFSFYDDPVAKTGGSDCTIDWVGSTFTYFGVGNLPFTSADELVVAIRDLANQSEADNIVEPQKLILPINLLVNYDRVGHTIAPGGAPFSVVKAKDLADGLEKYILTP